mmetsp:Transcript_95667/g.117234  ORF Transcript_95667/g.117234 Transcript_95667/m.117234 type:complete len:102 (+) Transcript_95667:43-348(+)
MNFFARIITHMLGDAASSKLAQTSFMRSLAKHTHKGIQKGADFATESKQMLENSKQTMNQMKSEAQNSPTMQYFKGLTDEVSTLKKAVKDEINKVKSNFKE